MSCNTFCYALFLPYLGFIARFVGRRDDLFFGGKDMRFAIELLAQIALGALVLFAFWLALVVTP
jgi:hypothetical protein